MSQQYQRGITFGAYDPVHYGHIRLFCNAKLVCAHLTVCLSTAAYIKKYKNREERLPIGDRMHDVSGVRYVDDVGIQDVGFGKAEAVRKYSPDVILVGSDWTKETFGGEGLGVPVIYLPHTPYISSTAIAASANMP